MTTTVLHAGGEMGAFVPSDGSVSEITTGGTFDAAYARCALRPGVVGAIAAYAASSAFAQTDGVWHHFNCWSAGPPAGIGGNPSTEYDAVFFYNNLGTAVFKLTYTGIKPVGTQAMLVRMYYWTGSAWAQVGVGFNVTTGTLNIFDVELTATRASCYVNGTLRDQQSVAMAQVAALTNYTLNNTYNQDFYSELIVADGPTLSWRLQTLPITGNGFNTAWGGGYADVNEIVYNDGSFIFSPTATQVSTFAIGNPTVVSNVLAIVVTARANRAPVGPQNLQLAIRTGGANFFSSTLALTSGYTGNVGIWMTNPNGSIAWTPTDAAAIEYGVKSIA